MTAASLSERGTEPDLREELIISMMSVEMTGKESLMK